jgi:hypothetical protein
MFTILKRDPVKKLNKLYEAKLEKAMHAQRNGDIKTYSELTFEANKIEQQMNELKEKLENT